MSTETVPGELQIVDLRTPTAWRRWLAKHHATEKEVWLVFHKKHTQVACISYDKAVREALCFGWIDSIMRRIDDDTYARKFTPRKKNSQWSSINRRRFAELKREGLLAAAGKKRPPTEKDGDAPALKTVKLPAYIARAFKKSPAAWRFFQSLAPSYKRNYIGWIDSAKKEETRLRRLTEAVSLLAKGKKLGMK